MKNDGALNKRYEMKQKLPTILTKLSKQVKRTTNAIIVAILYLGYRLSFAVDATATAPNTLAEASTASRRAISLCHSLNVIVYVPFNYDYNVYEQNNQYKKTAHAHTFSMFV